MNNEGRSFTRVTSTGSTEQNKAAVELTTARLTCQTYWSSTESSVSLSGYGEADLCRCSVQVYDLVSEKSSSAAELLKVNRRRNPRIGLRKPVLFFLSRLASSVLNCKLQLHVCTPAEMAGQSESWTTIGKVLHAISALPLSCFCFF